MPVPAGMGGELVSDGARHKPAQVMLPSAWLASFAETCGGTEQAKISMPALESCLTTAPSQSQAPTCSNPLHVRNTTQAMDMRNGAHGGDCEHFSTLEGRQTAGLTHMMTPNEYTSDFSL